ncbi:MAG: F390 synthetase-related protein [Sandaracinaceae bacterium]
MSVDRAILARSFVRARIEPRIFPTRSALLAWQDRKVISFLEWARVRSRHLDERFRGRPTTAWRSLPVTDKAETMARWDDVVTVPVQKDEALATALRAERERDFSPTVRGYTVGLSSGTSGNRGLFVASAEERAEWAGAAIARVVQRGVPGLLRAERVAFFLRASSNLYESVGSRRIAFRFFDLASPFDALVDPLIAHAPTILVAPPSMLRLLAEARLAGRMPIAPRIVVSVAEVLDPIDEGVIRRAFGTTVHQIYQATEGFLGSSCAYGTIHLAEDVVVIEREPVLGATNGAFHPIVTDFRRRSQPIVRYRLDDVLVPRTSRCPCGAVTAALDRIEGRADDLLVVGDGPLFPDFARRAVILADARIVDYRVVQRARDRVALYVDPLDAWDAAASALERVFAQRCASVTVERLDAPERDPLRKLRRVVCTFAPGLPT